MVVTAQQCKGFKRYFIRCKNWTHNGLGYCHLHRSQAPALKAVK